MARLIDADALYEKLIYRTTKTFADTGKYISVWRIADAINDAPTIEQPTWISCAERLPDEHVDVQMCWKATGTQATGFYTDESWYTYAEDGYYTDCEKAPTHWKAVGEPPKGDE